MAAATDPRSPPEILSLSPAGADALLGELESAVPTRPPLVELGTTPGGRAFVFGDSHGDWRSTLEVVRAFEGDGPSSVLIGLGDYVDRPPKDCPFGSVANALFLLALEAKYPSRVYLIQGNHETVRRIPASPPTSLRSSPVSGAPRRIGTTA